MVILTLYNKFHYLPPMPHGCVQQSLYAIISQTKSENHHIEAVVYNISSSSKRKLHRLQHSKVIDLNLNVPA